MKSNILFVGLYYEYVKQVSKKIADGFDMFFLDVNDLIEYSLINTKNVEEICGLDYLKRERTGVALSTIDYENTIINMPYSIFLETGMAEKLSKNALIVYLKFPKKVFNLINKKLNETLNVEFIAFEEFNKLLTKKTNLIVDCKTEDIDDGVKHVLDALKSNLL